MMSSRKHIGCCMPIIVDDGLRELVHEVWASSSQLLSVCLEALSAVNAEA